MKNLYETLGLSENASEEEIKRTYRKQSMKYHPDRPEGNAEKYKEINNAYDILGDKTKREEYDMERKGVNVEDLFGMFGMFGGMNMPMGNVRIFRGGMNMRPDAIEERIKISMREAYEGTKKRININKQIRMNNTIKRETETMYVDIPAGMDENEIMVIKGRGNVFNNEKGDVRVRIKIENESKFKRKGLDLEYEKEITFRESVCGFSFMMEYIDGKRFNINNQKGKVIYGGYTKTIDKLGMRRGTTRGNLHIKFKVKYPEEINIGTIEKLEKIMKEDGIE